ncbi:MAG: HAMP domain-containing protein, partial [Proteobacteria bacterium]|nr:HAMP domain-containing protein [Pseudomonadota bacterium]
MIFNRVKTKITMGALGIIIFTMTLTTIIVAVIIINQNRGISFKLVQQSMNIVRDDIIGVQEKLLEQSRQAAKANEMGANLEFISSMSYEMGAGMGFESMLQDMATTLYQIELTANIWKAAFYKKDGSLGGFALIDEKASLIGFRRSTDYLVAELKGNEKITSESWKPRETISGFSQTYPETLPNQESLEFFPEGEFLALKAAVPITATILDSETLEEKIQQVGVMICFYKFETAFAERMSRITGNKIGIVPVEGPVIGNLAGYDNPESERFDEVKHPWSIHQQKVILDTVDLEESSFFQGLLPIYSGKMYLGSIVALYSQDEASANAWFIIKAMSLVSLGCIIILIPLAYLFSKSFSGPLEKMSRLISNVELSGDFSLRADVSGKDEIGQTSAAFNHLMDSLQEAVSKINTVMGAVARGDLSNKVTGDFQGDLHDLKTNVNETMDV